MAVSHEEKLDRQLDAERAVIGSLLLDETIVRDVLTRVDAADFIDRTNRMIFQAVRAQFRAGEPVDPITIRGRIGREYSDYLVQLMEITPTAANWKVYADLMREQAALQRVKDLAVQLDEAVTLDGCREAVAALGQLMSDGRKVDAWGMKDMLDDFFAAQDPDAAAPEYFTYGLSVLDQGTFTQKGDVVMIGGEPSSGKTALSLMMAYHMAGKWKVGYFSLETGKQKVRDRMVATSMQIDFNDIKRRALREADWAALAAKQKDFAARDLTVIQASGMTATEITAISQAYGFDAVFIDYVQLVAPEIDRRAARSEQMADVSRALHVFAQKTGTLVVELAQLSRFDRSNGWREPVMQDLKESGQFEQDADLILMLYRPNPKDDLLDEEKNRILKIAKNKEYRRGKWPLFFDGSRQTFAVMMSEDRREAESKQVLRQLQDMGKAARARNSTNARRAQVAGQQRLDFREVPDTPDNPFRGEVSS